MQALLVENDRFLVGTTTPESRLMAEIARIRVDAFRQIGANCGEGLDGYDATYEHLYVWDKKAGKVAAATRVKALAGTDQGFGGFYSHSLFDFSPEFFRRIGPALEVGRMFVGPEYQKSPEPLYFLWQGLGHVTLAHRCRSFFGALTLSETYSKKALKLMVDYLRSRCFDPELGEGVVPRDGRLALGSYRCQAGIVDDIRGLGRRIAEIEGHRRGIPVLMRKYLELGGRIAAFHRDKAFRSIACLVTIDTAGIPDRIVERFMGAKAEEFRQFVGGPLPGRSLPGTRQAV